MRAIDGDALISDCQLAQKQADRHGREFANAFYSGGGEVSTEWWCVEDMIENAPTIEPERKKGKWIPVTRIEEWHEEEGLVGFPPEVKEFPQCTIKWVDATEPDEVDGLRCSECDTVYDFTEARNWCSECGADMRDSVETARDIVHEAIDNSVWSDTVDTAKMHKVVDDKYAEIRGDANADAES